MRKNQARRIVFLSVFVIVFATHRAFAETGRVSGNVTDTEGAVVVGAHILAHYDPSGLLGKPDQPNDIWVQTDKTGRFELQLASGFYDVCVFSGAFTASCSKINVRSGKTSRHDVRLVIDPIARKAID